VSRRIAAGPVGGLFCPQAQRGRLKVAPFWGARRGGRPLPLRRSPLTVARTLSWADAHRPRAGRWPEESSGPVEGAPGEAWPAVCAALRQGLRGLPGGDMLLRLLRRSGRQVPERRGRPHKAPGSPACLARRPAVPSARSRVPAVGAPRPQVPSGLRPFLLRGRKSKAPARAKPLTSAGTVRWCPKRPREHTSTRRLAGFKHLPRRSAAAAATSTPGGGLDHSMRVGRT
jgi:hypothetical protein